MSYGIPVFRVNKIYHIYPKYSDTSSYHTCSKIGPSTIYYQMLGLKIPGWVTNSVDPEATLHFVTSHLRLHCLLRPVCPNTYVVYTVFIVLRIQFYIQSNSRHFVLKQDSQVRLMKGKSILTFVLLIDWLIVLGFNDTSTLEGHFVSSPREREKRDSRENRGDEREGQGRKRNRNESEETEEIKTFPLYPYPLQG